MDDYTYPRVGVGVMVMRDGKVLLGKRNKTSHGEQLWCMPGGHLEHGESLEEAVRREAREEAGIEIGNIRFVVLMNQLAFLPKHFVGIGFVADWQSGEPRAEEGDKMIDWTWFDPAQPPEPCYEPSRKIIECYRNDGRSFIDTGL